MPAASIARTPASGLTTRAGSRYIATIMSRRLYTPRPEVAAQQPQRDARAKAKKQSLT